MLEPGGEAPITRRSVEIRGMTTSVPHGRPIVTVTSAEFAATSCFAQTGDLRLHYHEAGPAGWHEAGPAG
jgi:hypothetical protein